MATDSRYLRCVERYLANPVLRGSDYRCIYCDCDLLADVDLLITFVKDHLVPRGMGGRNGDSNRVASCAACDRLKRGDHFADLEEAQATIAGRRFCRLATFNAVRAIVRQGGAE